MEQFLADLEKGIESDIETDNIINADNYTNVARLKLLWVIRKGLKKIIKAELSDLSKVILPV